MNNSPCVTDVHLFMVHDDRANELEPSGRVRVAESKLEVSYDTRIKHLSGSRATCALSPPYGTTSKIYTADLHAGRVLAV